MEKYQIYTGGRGVFSIMKEILIVDDTAFMRNTLKELLKNEGYIIAGEAEDGPQAVEKYKELNPDLVTMDITMPEMNGIKAIEKILEHDKSARIIVISAMGQQSIILKAMKAGALDFLVKPIKRERLKQAIEKAFG